MRIGSCRIVEADARAWRENQRWAIRVLERLPPFGGYAEARVEFERAASLAHKKRELLLARVDATDPS